MFRIFTFICAALLGVEAFVVPASASPPSYDIFCSAGSTVSTSAKIRDPYVRYEFTTAAEPLGARQTGIPVCGWFTRAWRSGEPSELCMSETEDIALLNAGAVQNGKLVLQHVSSFAVYNDFNGCMVVTGFALNESHAFPASYIVCQDPFHPMPAPQYVGSGEAFAFKTAQPGTNIAPGSCYGLNGAALPPSGLLCPDTSGALPDGQVALSVKPWWPCGLAEAATGSVPGYTPPQLYTSLESYQFSVPVSISVPAADYAPPYYVTCYVHPDATNSLHQGYWGAGSAPVVAIANGDRMRMRQTFTITVDHQYPKINGQLPVMSYDCSLTHPINSNMITTNPITPVGNSTLEVDADFEPDTTSVITTSPISYYVP